MNLTIDQGNTFIKYAVFEGDDIIAYDAVKILDKTLIDEILSKYAIKSAILSSVGDTNRLSLDYLQHRIPGFVRLDKSTPLPIGNLYDTPATLGVDRLAVCVGANYLCPDTNLLVIDMGTCITYDVVNADNNFVGGNIDPGMSMRLKALHEYTAALPLVEPKDEVPLIGKNTNDAILAGVVQGIVNEIEGYRASLDNKYPNLSVFLTGGNAFFFERRLKSGIFANKNLLLHGLNRILNYLNA